MLQAKSIVAYHTEEFIIGGGYPSKINVHHFNEV